eukprot:gnl/Hemi2/2096_TR757_c0_g1_i1.p1 gnl/Hemi2/2096_TR757_c0_g1~~gnl/Hemi2/2096_TR757_c0_g1_i1.p1  ORF type:complete len:181 (+),score=34.96 gnl/Hemi2/2096_TR757_c0_g1_i1:198-740(+)
MQPQLLSPTIQRNDPDDVKGLDGPIGLVVWLGACYGVMMMYWLFLAYPLFEWYPDLNKPFWAPPSSVVYPVGIFAFTLQGFAMWICFREATLESNIFTIAFFGAQLGVGMMWAGVFFGARIFIMAFLLSIVWWITALGTLIEMWASEDGRIRLAGWVFLPSFALISFICALTFCIKVMNN